MYKFQKLSSHYAVTGLCSINGNYSQSLFLSYKYYLDFTVHKIACRAPKYPCYSSFIYKFDYNKKELFQDLELWRAWANGFLDLVIVDKVSIINI